MERTMTAAVTHCAKCSAELIGSRKFCTACGAPTVDPRATGTSAASAATAVPSSARPAPKLESSGAYGAPPAPPSQVNPFAQTAVPTNSFRASDYGPPPAPLPAAGQPPPSISSRSPSASPGSSVSPLAMSNVMSQADVLPDAGAASRNLADAPDAGRIPGTQVMPSVPNPSIGSTESKKPQERTQVMSAVALPRSNAAPSSAQPQSYGAPTPQAPAPQGYAAQPAYGAPIAAAAHAAQPAANPQGYAQAAYGHAPYAPHAQAAPQGYAAPNAYGAAFPPGSRVLVTWSDGRRYPGVVHQLSGTAHLVVFPDGQQHWVELPYLSPG